MGQRNLRLLKLLIPLSAVVFLLYILYEYRQANNDVNLQKRFLKESEEEFKTLNKRFDMLGMELKRAVQKTADIDKELRLEKAEHTQVISEKSELERQYQAESVRKRTENLQLSHENQQLMEEKADYKRERDRLSAQVQSLTQDLSDQHEKEGNHALVLQDTYAKIAKCTDRESSLNIDLISCTDQLQASTSQHTQCKEELLLMQKFKVDQDQKVEDLQSQVNQYELDKLKTKPKPRKLAEYQPGQVHGPGNRHVAEGISLDQQLPHHQVGDISHLQSDKALVGVEDVQVGRKYPALPRFDVKKKRAIYKNLKEMVQVGERLTSKQSHAYSLLSREFSDENKGRDARNGGQLPVRKSPHIIADKIKKKYEKLERGGHPHPVPVQNRKSAEMDSNPAPPHAPVPPVPANNNDHEEVKDLLDGPQKFKSQRGVGVPVDLLGDDDGVELHHEEEQSKVRNQEKVQGDGEKRPRPVLNNNGDNNNMPHPPLEKEAHRNNEDLAVPGQVGGNEDDEDADYRDERGRGKPPVHQDAQFEHEHVDGDGHNAYLNDQHMYEEERQRLHREPKDGVAKARLSQARDLEKQLQGMLNSKHREIR